MNIETPESARDQILPNISPSANCSQEYIHLLMSLYIRMDCGAFDWMSDDLIDSSLTGLIYGMCCPLY